MSNIVLVLKERSVEISVLKELHKLLGGSLADIRASISQGRPIVETEIFDNKYEEKAYLLRRVIDLIRINSIAVEVYELPEDDTFEESQSLNSSLINIEVLENILDSSDREMDRQLDV